MRGTFSRRAVVASAVGAAILQLAFASQATAQARAETNISLLSAPFGGGAYILSNALEQLSKKHHPWLRISSSETPGFVYNLKKYATSPELAKTTIWGSGPVVMSLAAEGQRPFDTKISRRLKLIGNFVVVVVWLSSTNSSIKAPSDLQAKRIALGQAAQINWAVLPRAVIEHGWGILKQVNVQYLGPKPAMAALLDGKVDLALAAAYVDPESGNLALSPQTSELIASGRQLQHVSWGPDAITKTIAKGFDITPYKIAAGKIEKMSPEIDTFTDTASWMVDAEFPEDIAYEVTKLILEHLGTFGEVHAIGKLMSKSELIHGWKIADIHPGALRAYKEAGVIK